MAGLSFTTSGAVPSFGIPSQGMSGSTQAVGGATTNLGTQIGTALKNNQNSGFPSTSSPAANALNSAVAPSTPVKSQTTTSPDGTVNSVTYHPPATGSNSSSSGTNAGVLPKAPVAPLAVTQTPYTPQSDPTYNPTTGSTASNPTYASGVLPSNGNPNSQFQSSNPNNLPSTSFGGIVSGLANTSANGSQAGQNYTADTANYGAGNIPIGQQAEQIAANAGQQMANVGEKYANFEGGQLTSGGSTPVEQGGAAITAQIGAAKQAAIAAGAQTALQGTAQALTGQNQAAGASNEAAGQANTAQANTQSGLASAGSLSAPTSNFPFSFNPQTGQFTNAASGASGSALTYNPTTDAATLAKEVIAGNIPYSDAVTAMGYAPNNVGTGALQQAIVQAGGNIASLEGQAAGQQAAGAAPGQAAATNIATAGTAATTGTAASLQATEKTYNDMSALNTTASQQAQTVQDVLKSTGLNEGVPAFTKPLNSLSGQLGSAKVTALTSAVTEMQNIYGQLLASGGTTPSGSEAQALALLSPNSTPQQINAAIGQLQTAAYNKLSGQYGQLQTEQSALTSNTNSNASNSNPTGWF